MTGQSHDALERGEFCQAAEQIPHVTLLCWLAPGHGGDHWDKVDKAHWHTEPELKVTACEHKVVAS